jgi:hypothetical protein
MSRHLVGASLIAIGVAATLWGISLHAKWPERRDGVLRNVSRSWLVVPVLPTASRSYDDGPVAST